LQFWIETGRLKVPSDRPITMFDLKASGIVMGKVIDGIKLLSNVRRMYIRVIEVDIM
jgi:hypothetical protein